MNMTFCFNREINDEPLRHAQPVSEAGERFSDPWAIVRSELQRTAGAAQEQTIRARHVCESSNISFNNILWFLGWIISWGQDWEIYRGIRKPFACLTCFVGSCRIPEWWPHSLCCWDWISLRWKKKKSRLPLLLPNQKRLSHLLPKRKTFLKTRERQITSSYFQLLLRFKQLNLEFNHLISIFFNRPWRRRNLGMPHTRIRTLKQHWSTTKKQSNMIPPTWHIYLIKQVHIQLTDRETYFRICHIGLIWVVHEGKILGWKNIRLCD